jgi:hypothetical protein
VIVGIEKYSLMTYFTWNEVIVNIEDVSYYNISNINPNTTMRVDIVLTVCMDTI